MRETIEAAIIVSVLLGLVESLVDKTESNDSTAIEGDEGDEGDGAESTAHRKKRLIKRMRWQSEPRPSASSTRIWLISYTDAYLFLRSQSGRER